MIAYRGRSKHTTKLKNKPINEGYKIWIFAEYGYVWSWLWYSLEEGIEYTVFAFDTIVPDAFDSTKQIIVQLALELDYTKYDYILYFDNLFTNMFLLNVLKKLPISVTDTTHKIAIGILKKLFDTKQKNSELIWNSVLSRIVGKINVFL
jgi:hypothetical protein